jgi:hypothetical protein
MVRPTAFQFNGSFVFYSDAAPLRLPPNCGEHAIFDPASRQNQIRRQDGVEVNEVVLRRIRIFPVRVSKKPERNRLRWRASRRRIWPGRSTR